MNLEDIRLSEMSQSQKDRHCWIPLLGEIWQSRSERNRTRFARGCKEGGHGQLRLNGDRVPVPEDEEVLEMAGDDGHAKM